MGEGQQSLAEAADASKSQKEERDALVAKLAQDARKRGLQEARQRLPLFGLDNVSQVAKRYETDFPSEGLGTKQYTQKQTCIYIY